MTAGPRHPLAVEVPIRANVDGRRRIGEKKPLVILPYTTRIDGHGRIRLSSHSALVTAAGRAAFEEGLVSEIYIPGENTFGPSYPSTSELMKRYLVRRGVPETTVHTAGGLNSTEDQVRWLKSRNLTEAPRVVAMAFHVPRTRMLLRQFGLAAHVLPAEEVILRSCRRATRQRLAKLAASRVPFRLPVLGIAVPDTSNVYVAEMLIRTGTRYGAMGRGVVHLLRKLARQGGPTVTDYHSVEPAQNHLEAARRRGLPIRDRES